MHVAQRPTRPQDRSDRYPLTPPKTQTIETENIFPECGLLTTLLIFPECGLLTTLLIGSQHQRYLASNQRITSTDHNVTCLKSTDFSGMRDRNHLDHSTSTEENEDQIPMIPRPYPRGQCLEEEFRACTLNWTDWRKNNHPHHHSSASNQKIFRCGHLSKFLPGQVLRPFSRRKGKRNRVESAERESESRINVAQRPARLRDRSDRYPLSSPKTQTTDTEDFFPKCGTQIILIIPNPKPPR